jgi:hypothetical protein
MKYLPCFFLGSLLAASAASGLHAQSLDVTSTGINATAIGATTPSTGKFTTLRADGSAMMAGGLSSIADMYGGGLALYARASDDFCWGPIVKNNAGTAFIGGLAWNPSGFLKVCGGSGLSQIALFTSSGLDVTGSVSATAFNTTSDARLKTNIRDFTDSGRLIDALRPRVFDWKSGGKDVIGFIAQEENAADPAFAKIGAVTVGDDDPSKITRQWQRSDQALVPILVAEVQLLRARAAASESALAELRREVAELKRGQGNPAATVARLAAP